jgi:DNA mismatch repair protein MutL
MPIHVLPPDVASRIAAGEVIERPASVVKELLENALDAGATDIIIEIQNGGVSFIRVTDNGVGLSAEEARLAFTRHATSKITGLDDLERIITLGFRGEALPSIAAVAEVEMLTSDGRNAGGAYLRLENGDFTAEERRGRAKGTTVTVRRLFASLPARLKFLKSSQTESSHIATVVSQYALAFPAVRFNLSIDGRASLRTNGDGNLRSSASQVYGLDTAQKMLEVGSGDDLLRISGLAGPPSVQRSSRSYLSFFVNHRCVRNSLLNRAVDQAYAGLLMTGRHPLVILNISLPTQDVDVNVHPTKQEVKFRSNNAVFNAVAKALRDALDKAPLPAMAAVGSDDSLAPSLWERFLPSVALPALRTVGQLSSSYILAEGPEGLYLIDQHAAHERILFERVLKQRAEQKPEVQGMLEPLAVELTPAQDAALEGSLELLGEFGFTLEHFGGRTCLVRTVPAVLNSAQVLEALKELLEALAGEPDALKREVSIARSLACHGAVRAGQQLDNEEIRSLIMQLEKTSSPRTCPHGRPTMIHLSSQQLKKEFGRTG